MPDINTRGDVTGGRGRCWRTDHITEFDPTANIMAARNGRWFGCRIGHGVYDDGGMIPGIAALVGDMNSARGAMGQDGTIAFWPDYPNGGTVQLVAMDGSRLTIRDAFPQGHAFAILDATRAFWINGSTGEKQTVGLPVPVTLPGFIGSVNLFEVEGEPWLAYHSEGHIGIVVHPFDRLQGYRFPPGFYLCVRQTSRGVVLCSAANPNDDPNAAVVLDVSAPRLNLMDFVPIDDPPPPDNPDEPEEPPVSTPNRSDVVREIFAKFPPAPNSTESCAMFTRRVAYALNPEGHPGSWGLLTKSPGEAQHDGYAVDAIIYGQTQQVVDIIGGAEGPNPQPGWLEVDKRPNNNWAKPVKVDGTGPVDPVDPNKPTDDDLKKLRADIEAMHMLLHEQDERIHALEARPAPSIDGKVIALKSDSGQYVCADLNISPKRPLMANRDEVGSWERFTIEEQR